MLQIDATSVRNAASLQEWVAVMKQALVSGPHYDKCMLKRQHIDHGRNTFLLMPCVNDDYWVTKLVSFCPGNPGLGKPSIFGTVVLNDSRTGELLAVMDGGMVTAMRTAAVSAAGLDLLAPQNVKTLGIVGAGKQGMYQALLACQVRKFERICYYDKAETSAAGFARFAARELPGLPVEMAKSPGALARDADVIITASNSEEPVFPDVAGLLTGKTIIAVGSYKPDFRELPPSVYSDAPQVFVDTMHALTESGDLVIPIRDGLITKESILPMARLIKGEVPLEGNRTRIFKTVGSAVYDLFAAELIYRKTGRQQENQS